MSFWKKFIPFGALVLVLATSEGLAKEKYYIIGCAVLDGSFQKVRAFPGRFCAFFEDGSYVSAGIDNVLRRISPRGRQIWARNLSVHHQMKSSLDHKRLFLLSSEVRDGPVCLSRYDTVEVLEIESGKSLYHWSSFEHGRELFEISHHVTFKSVPESFRMGLNFGCEPFHFNSIYEIPVNPIFKTNPVFAPGSYLVGALGLDAVIILDPELGKIVWSRPAGADWGPFHDVQVTPDGGVLMYFNGRKKGWSGGRIQRRIEIRDSKMDTVKWRFPRSDLDAPKDFDPTVAGGAQLVDEGVLFSVNHLGEGARATIYLISKRGEILKKVASPYLDWEGKSGNFQEIKEMDVSAFLANNSS